MLSGDGFEIVDLEVSGSAYAACTCRLTASAETPY